MHRLLHSLIDGISASADGTHGGEDDGGEGVVRWLLCCRRQKQSTAARVRAAYGSATRSKSASITYAGPRGREEKTNPETSHFGKKRERFLCGGGFFPSDESKLWHEVNGPSTVAGPVPSTMVLERRCAPNHRPIVGVFPTIRRGRRWVGGGVWALVPALYGALGREGERKREKS